MNGWKYATFVLGTVVIVLLGRDVMRGRDRGAATRVGSTRPHERQPADRTPDPDSFPRSEPANESRAESDDNGPRVQELPDDPAEFVLALLPMYPGQPTEVVTEEQRIALLQEREAEVVPVLERWMQTLIEHGPQPWLNERLLFRTYGMLRGPDALPMLREALERGQWQAVDGLIWIDDPEAVRVLEAQQAAAAPNTWIVGPLELLRGAERFQTLALRWALEGVPNHPELDAPFYVLKRGSNAQRRLVLESLSESERRFNVLALVNASWPQTFREELRRTALATMRNGPSPNFFLACQRIAQYRELFDPAEQAEMISAVEAAVPQVDAEGRRKLEKILVEHKSQRRFEERRARHRAELLR